MHLWYFGICADVAAFWANARKFVVNERRVDHFRSMRRIVKFISVPTEKKMIILESWSTFLISITCRDILYAVRSVPDSEAIIGFIEPCVKITANFECVAWAAELCATHVQGTLSE